MYKLNNFVSHLNFSLQDSMIIFFHINSSNLEPFIHQKQQNIEQLYNKYLNSASLLLVC